MIQVTAKVEDYNKNMPQDVDRIIRAGLDRLAAEAQRVAVQEAPANTGALRNSILTFREYDPPEYKAGIATNLAYGIVMEEGRRPGAWPPVAAIQRWVWLKRREFVLRIFPSRGVSASAVRRRGGRIVARRPTQAQQVRQIAFLVSRKIKERGIPGHGFFRKAAARVEALLGSASGSIDVSIQRSWDQGG